MGVSDASRTNDAAGIHVSRRDDQQIAEAIHMTNYGKAMARFDAAMTPEERELDCAIAAEYSRDALAYAAQRANRSGLVIRPSEIADSPALSGNLWVFRAHDPSDASRNTTPHFGALIALVDDLPIGGISVANQRAPKAVIPALWVAPEHRRSGIGRALLGALVADLRMRGATGVTLHVSVGNAPAISLYEAAGWSCFEAGDYSAGYRLDLRDAEPAR
jgi:ribosomal protein S18 acetylase RimI-like enzyme